MAVPPGSLAFSTSVSWDAVGSIRMRLRLATLWWSVRASVTVRLSTAAGLGTLTRSLNVVLPAWLPSATSRAATR